MDSDASASHSLLASQYAMTSTLLRCPESIRRNRGTEYMKSPEMLVVGNATNQTRSKNHDRRRREGAGTPADVWALGCLLYELLTERILFYDPDWIRFFLRLTQSKEVCTVRPFRVQGWFSPAWLRTLALRKRVPPTSEGEYQTLLAVGCEFTWLWRVLKHLAAQHAQAGAVTLMCASPGHHPGGQDGGGSPPAGH